MKKLVLALLIVVNSLYALSLSQIDLGTHPRAFITQVDLRDQNEWATKLNTVTYQYWNSGYPYDSMKYSGKIESWVYTFDYNNFYEYSTFWDTYINQDDLSVTYVYFELNGYSSGQLNFFYYEAGSRVNFSPSLIYVSGSLWAFKHTNSKNVRSYGIETNIQASDGSVKLGNSVQISRDIK